jgi:hypothetical protein
VGLTATELHSRLSNGGHPATVHRAVSQLHRAATRHRNPIDLPATYSRLLAPFAAQGWLTETSSTFEVQAHRLPRDVREAFGQTQLDLEELLFDLAAHPEDRA